MPDAEADLKAQAFLEECLKETDSAGGVVECVVRNCFAGIGSPVFDKLDARLSQAIFSIGAVKAVEIGDGIKASNAKGSDNNDNFLLREGKIVKETNHAGGILGGISDGSDIVLRAHFKPTPSIYKEQHTYNFETNDVELLEIKGRHDSAIVERAMIVLENAVAIALCDLFLIKKALN